MLDMKRRELLMLWPSTVTEELRNDVRFALRFKVGRKQQPLTDTQRDMVAAAIVEHIRLCPAVCLGELPRNSLGARMRGHAQPQNLTAGMPQNQSSADVGKHRFIFVMEEIRQGTDVFREAVVAVTAKRPATTLGVLQLSGPERLNARGAQAQLSP